MSVICVSGNEYKARIQKAIDDFVIEKGCWFNAGLLENGQLISELLPVDLERSRIERFEITFTQIDRSRVNRHHQVWLGYFDSDYQLAWKVDPGHCIITADTPSVVVSIYKHWPTAS